MKIPILSPAEVKKMRIAGKHAAQVLRFIEPYVRPGVSTGELNRLCHDYIVSNGGIPAPLLYRGFPKSICTSINDVICHGIPMDKEILKTGDIINIDVTVIVDGYHGDTSRTFFVGEVSEQARLLVERTEKAMLKGIAEVRPGAHFNDIGKTIEKYVSKYGYGIVEDYTGHGIGKDFHNDPPVFHFDTGQPGPRMEQNMAFTIEPMINAGSDWRTVTDKKDGWTVRTADGSLSAQFEHTILVSADGYEILTII